MSWELRGHDPRPTSHLHQRPVHLDKEHAGAREHHLSKDENAHASRRGVKVFNPRRLLPLNRDACKRSLQRVTLVPVAAVAFVVVLYSHSAVRFARSPVGSPSEILRRIAFGKMSVRPLEVAPASGGDEEPLGASTTFLLGIFSTLSESDRRRRELIRETYLSDDIAGESVCSLADYRRSDERDNADGRLSKCRVVYTFVVGANPDGPAERFEGEDLTLGPPSGVEDGSAAEQDVVYLDIRENMEDGKTPTWFRYGVSLFTNESGGGGGGFDYVGKVDSDALLNTKELVRLVREDLPPAPHNRRTYGGRPVLNFFFNGGYMAGEFYFASSDLARYATNDLTKEQRAYLSNGIEDMDFGSYVLSHPKPVNMVLLTNRVFWYHPVKKDSEWRTLWNMALPPRHAEKIFFIPEWMRRIIIAVDFGIWAEPRFFGLFTDWQEHKFLK